MGDIEKLQDAIDYADVFAFGFRLLSERLFVDTRSNEQQGAMIRVVEPMASVPERFFWLGKERPSFGPPERFIFIPWPHSLRYLEESGVMKRIEERLTAKDPAMAEACRAAFAELQQLERRTLIDAVRGQGQYQTLWAAAR